MLASRFGVSFDDIIEITQLRSRQFASFKMVLRTRAIASKLYDPKHWPTNSVIRAFKPPRNTGGQSNHSHRPRDHRRDSDRQWDGHSYYQYDHRDDGYYWSEDDSHENDWTWSERPRRYANDAYSRRRRY